mmetsp:Transcript_76148/g.126901  ORF Transcript_76148/g.126901 Transcript_76148/m.126901 type:complete len:229 (-) Transcript_76148:81-767(-)
MLSKAAKKVSQSQRSAFFALLRTHDFLVPTSAHASDQKELAKRVAEDVAEEADALIARYRPALPVACERAPVHLQMASLALGAQRTLLREADKEAFGWTGGEQLRARSVVAGALGVVAAPDGSTPYGAPVMWLPNRMAHTFSWNKAATLERMVDNFQADLGLAFELEQIEPAPSRRMVRCLYTDFFRAEGEPLLIPVFRALHEATFKGVPSFSFETSDEGPDCTFWFK